MLVERGTARDMNLGDVKLLMDRISFRSDECSKTDCGNGCTTLKIY